MLKKINGIEWKNENYNSIQSDQHTDTDSVICVVRIQRKKKKTELSKRQRDREMCWPEAKKKT